MPQPVGAAARGGALAGRLVRGMRLCRAAAGRSSGPWAPAARAGCCRVIGKSAVIKIQSITPETQGKGDIYARIHDMMPAMSRSQKVIANAILAYPRLFAEKPIDELVPWLGVSAPTITRFCRTVGCEGLRDLKLQVMGATGVGMRYYAAGEPPSTVHEVREQLALRATGAIGDGAQVSDEALELAIERIAAAGTIYAFGSGGVSSWLVDEIQNRFFRLGKTVIPCRDGVMQTMFAASMAKDSLILCCSMGGSNRAQLDAIRIAQEYKAFCIAICPADSAMAEAVDLCLPVETHEYGDVLCPTPVRYAMLFVIDVLAYGTAIRSRDRVIESLRRLKHQFVAHVEGDEMRPLGD